MKYYTQVNVKNPVDFVKQLNTMIKLDAFNERYVHFYQPNNVSLETDLDAYKKDFVVNSQQCTLYFDCFNNEITFNPNQPLFIVNCNTEQNIWVLVPEKVKMTKMDMANLMDLENPKGFCRIRYRHQVLNAYISKTVAKIIYSGI